MNLQEIRTFLKEIYKKPLLPGYKRHIVFWYDNNEDFKDDIDDINLEGVKLLKLTSHNYFYVKYYIEKENIDSDILIYSNLEKPQPAEDWLYDILAYSDEFSTDRETVIMRELGINDISLKPIFKLYNSFFRRKERTSAFKALNIENYNAQKIHLGILAVLTKVKILDFEEILKAIIKDNLNGEDKLYEEIRKFGDEDVLWSLIEKVYGYSINEDKNLNKFMALILVTNLKEQVNFNLPSGYKRFMSHKENNCEVFLNHFMNHKEDNVYFNRVQEKVGKALKINKLLENEESDKFLKCDIFEEVDKIIISRIINLINSNLDDYKTYLDYINSRRTLHFYEKYENEYNSLKWAMSLLEKKKELDGIIKSESSAKFIKSYVNDYSIIDKAYRKFYYYFDKCDLKEELLSLKEVVENNYNNWYLQELSSKWFEALNDKDSWTIDGLNKQERFYKDNIKYSKEKIFVIISDALRYESAEELSILLTNERKGKVDLSFMQGVLPSYTKLGMAALLPNDNIEIDSSYNILVNGLNSSGTKNREIILKSENEKSRAFTYNELMDMNTSEFRKQFVGLEVVYIYHNTIDAKGDHASTEREVFEATELAFREIMNLVNRLASASASNIIITSDHGYLYKRSSIQEFNKIEGIRLNDGEDNRRFLLTTDRKEIEGTKTFSLNYLPGNSLEKYVTVPKGTLRFKVKGAGANYVHGGAMPQEIIIPLIKFKNDRSASSENDIRKAKISLTNIGRKITSPTVYLEFFQEEKIQDKVIAQRVRCYFEDEEGNKISNENIIIGDSISENPKERLFKEKFVLKGISYDKRKTYFLVIRDEDSNDGIYERIAYNIDIAIVDDFEF